MMEIADTNSGVPAFLTSIMAAVRSEAADPSNRRIHLGNAERLLPNVNFHYVDDRQDAGSGIYDMKWIEDIMQRYLTNQRSLKILMESGVNTELDTVKLLNEMDYRNVPDIMELQMSTNSAYLQERMLCGDRGAGLAVVTNMLSAKSFSTANSTRKALSKYYMLLTVMDRYV
ncbi:hypothetical protein K450DRAFT_262913 [Umbelopsis ramanniana AG]|uniref:Uncharacterized protein n=1 Tax=Umbelopsis ramanniana AG TaxID=1314678 RepID=A0AAD5E0L9_UMBRA|nr:uncharacterized protein K450DRAFT_262913 [Umbelopsis ramanniana AG]KAI8575213.1 hypothetical protein K450DRAFT_262913 [Umbelopsis ramanniana AG]